MLDLGAQKRAFSSLSCVALLGMMALWNTASAHSLEVYETSKVPPGSGIQIQDEPAEDGATGDGKPAELPRTTTAVFATGRSKLIGVDRWLEIVTDTGTSWTNANALRPANGKDFGRTPEFNCTGTEPFWSLSLNEHTAKYDDGGDARDLTVASVQTAQGRREAPILFRLRESDGHSTQAAVSQRQWCTDGISDYEYAFQVLLTSDRFFREGCCVLKK